MKRKSLLSMAIAMGVIMLGSCGKEGALGPAGPTGPQGEVGQKGETGAKGADGTLILNGTVGPKESDGKIGDFYIDTKAGTLFGPKTTSGWGLGTPLKGEAGAAGSQFLSGTTAPNQSTGKIGDFYFRTSNTTLYGPKSEQGWGSGISLMGNANVNVGEGWIHLNELTGSSGAKWERDYRAWNMIITSPGDVGLPFYFPWWSGSVDFRSGLTVLYVDDGNAVRMCNFTIKVEKFDEDRNLKIDADLEFRFVLAPPSAPTMGHMMYPVVAVRRGVVDDDYMANVYLKSLKFKTVNIPAHIAKIPGLDLKNYDSVMKALNRK